MAITRDPTPMAADAGVSRAENPAYQALVAGLAVAVRPRFGGYLVAAWLAALIANLLLQADFYDIALRDFALLLGALTLARLAVVFERPASGLRGHAA